MTRIVSVEALAVMFVEKLSNLTILIHIVKYAILKFNLTNAFIVKIS